MKTEYVNNMLIVKFMNVELWIDDGSLQVYKFPNGEMHGLGALKYHNSWDWLMPVVYKIKWLGDVDDEHYDEIDAGLTNALITQTYDAVINFIKKYNNGATK